MTAATPAPPSRPTAEDHALIVAAQAGDRAALGQLIERHAARVARFALSMCRDRADADEVAQDTLLAAARTLPGFREGASVSTWLFAIARSFCIKKRRRTKGRPAFHQPLQAPGLPDLADPNALPDERLADRELGAALEKAIADLPPMYREVLLLRDVEGLTAPEVAQALGLRVEAVKSRLHRARLQVRQALGGMVEGPAEGTPRAPSCPDVARLWSRHQEGDIDADLCAQMQAHTATCPACRATCAGLDRLLTVCKSHGAQPVPTETQAALREAVGRLLRAA